MHLLSAWARRAHTGLLAFIHPQHSRRRVITASSPCTAGEMEAQTAVLRAPIIHSCNQQIDTDMIRAQQGRQTVIRRQRRCREEQLFHAGM